MFKFLRRKNKSEDDEIMQMLKKQDEELKELHEYFNKHKDEVEREIIEAETALKNLGYSDEDLERLKMKSKLKLVK